MSTATTTPAARTFTYPCRRLLKDECTYYGVQSLKTGQWYWWAQGSIIYPTCRDRVVAALANDTRGAVELTDEDRRELAVLLNHRPIRNYRSRSFSNHYGR